MSTNTTDEKIDSLLFIIQNLKLFVGFGAFFVTIIFGLLMVIGRGFIKGFGELKTAIKDIDTKNGTNKSSLDIILSKEADRDAKLNEMADRYHRFASSIDKEIKAVDRQCFEHGTSIKRIDDRLDDFSGELDKVNERCDRRHEVRSDLGFQDRRQRQGG